MILERGVDSRSSPVLVRAMEQAEGMLWGVLGGGAMAVTGLWRSLRYLRRARLVADLPTVTTLGAYVGVLELAGQVEPLQFVVGHLSGKMGAWVSWSIEEEWRRTTTSTDSKGRTRTRTSTGWTTVASGREEPRFLVYDTHGAVAVEPVGAEVTATRTVSWHLTQDDARFYDLGPPTLISDSTGNRRFTEHMLLPGNALWILGHARIDASGSAVEIAAEPGIPDYVMSVAGEAAVRSSVMWAWILSLFAALLGAGLVGWLLAQERGLVAALLITLGAWAMGWVLVAYNSLIGLRQRVLQAQANIAVQLQRRADLIPSLVTALQALRGHEREVQVTIAQLRAQAQATLPGKPGPDPVAVRGLVEAYPELMSSAATRSLMEELSRTEDRIALARGFATEVGSALNTRLESIPDGWFARLAGCAPVALFQADGFTRRAPAVSLA